LTSYSCCHKYRIRYNFCQDIFMPFSQLSDVRENLFLHLGHQYLFSTLIHFRWKLPQLKHLVLLPKINFLNRLFIARSESGQVSDTFSGCKVD